MKSVFADTSALIALGNKRDAFHSQAVRINDKLRKSKVNFVTTDAVLLELGNAFSPLSLKLLGIKLIEVILYTVIV